jgi:hypothetical protein
MMTMTHQPKPVGKSICPTPLKIRFGSRRDAKKSITDQGDIGVKLHTYECVCGFHHLTKSPGMSSVDSIMTVVAVPHALGLNDDEFREFVRFDVVGRLTADESAILRDAQIAPRWSKTLLEIRRDAERDLRHLSGLPSKGPGVLGRRAAKIKYLEDVGVLQAEANKLLYDHGIVRVTEPRSETKIRRASAGERALQALVSRYRVEFTKIFMRECELLGFDDALTEEDALEKLTVKALRELRPHDGTRPLPRYPDVHVVLTGAEDFYDIATAVVSGIYTHLRGDDDRIATEAIFDIVGALHRTTYPNVAEAVNIVREWVTLVRPLHDVLAETDE